MDKRGLSEGLAPLQEAPSSKRLKLDDNAAAAGAGAGPAAAWCPPTREDAAEAHGAPSMRSSPRPSSAGSLHPAKEEPMMLDLHADTAAPDQAAKPDQLWAAAAAAASTAIAAAEPPPPPAAALAPDAAAAPAPASPPAAASPADVPAGGPDASASAAALAAAAGALAAPSALGGLIAPMAGLLEGASPGADGDAAAEAASALQQLLTAAASAASAGAHGLPPGVTAVPLLLPPEMISQLGGMPPPGAEAGDNDGDEDFDPAVDDESDLHGGSRLSAKATAQGAKAKPGAAALVQRMQRRKNASPSTSSYKGVTRHRRTGRWEAHIWDGASPAAGAEAGVTARPGGRGKQLYLGSYDTELDAARVYDRAALAFFKRKAVLNFNIEDYEDELAGLLAITDRSQAVQLIRTRFRTTGAKTRSSKYRGVSLHASGRWEARITLGAGADRRYKGTKFLGLFDSQEQAAAAYDAAALQLHGDRAVLNFEESATATAAAVAELAASGNATAGHILLAQQQAGEAGSIKAMVKQLNELEAAAAAAGEPTGDAPLDAAADGAAAIAAAAAAALPPQAPTQPPKKSRSGVRKPKHAPPPLAPLAAAGVPGLPALVPASAAAFGAPLPPWGGGDAGRSPPRDETDPLVLAAHAGAAASAAATAAALASGSIATTRQRRSNAGKRLTKYGSEDYEADDATLQMLAEQGVDLSALPPPAPLLPHQPAAAPVPKARKQSGNWGAQRPLAGGGGPGGALGGGVEGGLGDALMALATAAGGADSANDDGDLLGFPVPLPKGLRLQQPHLIIAGAGAGAGPVPGLPQLLGGGGDLSADAGDDGAAAVADGDASAAAAATSINPIDAAAVAHATAAAVARASAAAAKVAAREAALKPMVMAAQDSRPPRGGSALRTAARKRAMAEAAQQHAFGMLHASVGPAFAAAAAAAAAAALAAAPPMTPAASGALPRLPAGHGHGGADAGSSEPASAAASGSTGGAHAPRLPPLPEIDFVPGEVTDPKAKSLAVNGVLSLLKALDIDSVTRARVFKSLNAQLADAASAAHFLSVPYQFMRWCCSEGDVDAVRTAVLEIASADVPGAAASVDGGSM